MAQTDCPQTTFEFQVLGSRKVQANFDGGHLSSDGGGALFLREVEALLIDEGVKAIPRKSKEIVIDFDATDDPLHGSQEGAYFNGYYRHYCYLPLYAFCGNVPLWSELRDCKRDGSLGTAEALQKIVPRIRKRFGKNVRIIVRGDGGVCRESIMGWCDSQEKDYYCVGLSTNQRLRRIIAPKLGKLQHDIAHENLELPVRRFTEFSYATLDSWSRKRRLSPNWKFSRRGKTPASS